MKCIPANVVLFQHEYVIRGHSVNFIFHHHAFQSTTPGGDSFYCSSKSKSFSDLDCFNGCINGTSSITCSGDSQYCSGHKCVPELAANCKCESVTVSVTDRSLVNGKVVVPRIGNFGHPKPLFPSFSSRDELLSFSRRVYSNHEGRKLLQVNGDVFNFDVGEYNSTTAFTILSVPDPSIIEVALDGLVLVVQYPGNSAKVCFTVSVFSGDISAPPFSLCGVNAAAVLSEIHCWLTITYGYVYGFCW